MVILVVYESPRGRARDTAEAVARAAASHGVATLISSIDEDVAKRVAKSADALIAGCWISGKVPFGGAPTQRMFDWIESLPPLEGKPVGVFCMYKFFPNTFADMATRTAEVESTLASSFEVIGGNVVASSSINLKSIDEGAALLVEMVLEHLS
jgi:flavodoxin